MNMKLKEIYFFERSLRFLPGARNFFLALRPYVQRILMVVIFLQAVRTFVAANGKDNDSQLGYFESFQEIYASIFLVFVFITLLAYIIKKLEAKHLHSVRLLKTGMSAKKFLKSQKRYDHLSRFVFSIILSTAIMLVFESRVAVPFFLGTVVFSFLLDSTLLAMKDIQILRTKFIRTSVMELIMLCVYVLSLCSYFYYFGAPSLNLTGLFVIIMVPRIAFNATRQYLLLG